MLSRATDNAKPVPNTASLKGLDQQRPSSTYQSPLARLVIILAEYGREILEAREQGGRDESSAVQ